MPVIAVQGIRSGTGTTSIVAGLSWALQKLGESVLAVDFSPNNMLRLHFNTPIENQQGWARAVVDSTKWESSALRYETQLDFLPFGVLNSQELGHIQTHVKHHPLFWHSHFETLKNTYKWILLDLPATSPELAHCGFLASQHQLALLNPDVNCHVRLHQQTLPEGTYILLNSYLPTSKMQRDLLLTWQNSLEKLLPLMIHHDEALAEAFASKQPIGEYAPGNLSSNEVTTLANWCLLHLKGDTT